MLNDSPLTWAEIDLKAIEHNYKELKKLAYQQRPPRSKAPIGLLAVIKADAYGHGMLPVANLLDRLGVEFFGVSNVAEGVELRTHGILSKPILLFESTMASSVEEIIEYNLSPTVCTYEFAQRLNERAAVRNRRIDVHVKVDTGMGRLGIWHREAKEFIKKIMELPQLSIKGLYTHLASADKHRSFTQKQIKLLADIVKQLDRLGLIVPYIHAANSMGLAGYKHRILNLARAGLMFYGLYPDKFLKRKIKLKPAMTVKSKVIFLKDIGPGRSISYGRTFIAKKRMRVATIPIGYSDGYFRSFSNQASVLIGGKVCDILGRVTMDQVIVDVSKVKNVQLGDEVVVMGAQGKEEISADDLAELADTINYEVICSLGNRLGKVYKN